MSKGKLTIAAALAALVAAGVIALVVGRATDGPELAERMTSSFPHAPEVPAWDTEEASRTGTIRGTGDVEVGGITLRALWPDGFEGNSSLESVGGDVMLRKVGRIGDEGAAFEWHFGAGNPHTSFAGEWSAPLANLTEHRISTILQLGPGDLLYTNSAYELVPLAAEEVTLSNLQKGPIVWRNGAETVTFSQWTADRVEIRSSGEAGPVLEFVWWDPFAHHLPEDCGEELAKVTIKQGIGVMVSFDAAPPVALSRLAGGSTGAAIPVFFDPSEMEDARFRDAAASSAADFGARARTIALGHSDPADGRHGNGGLAGTGVGGTIVVPAEYADHESIVSLRSDTTDTTVEVLDEATAIPESCTAWLELLGERIATIHTTDTFDGSFPNLLDPNAINFVPAPTSGLVAWPAIELTGRRKDVVQQTLSRTYLEKLEERRGFAVLRVPMIATRNPLVAASAEAILEPERQGQWTLEENVSRALAEIELLAEERHFALLGVEEMTRHLLDVRRVTYSIDETGALKFVNRAGSGVSGLTVVVDASTVPVSKDAELTHEVRQSPQGRPQTWFWFDLPASGAATIRLEQPQTVPSSGIRWGVPAP